MFTEEVYPTWKDFEMIERRKMATFQLSIDALARDLYLDTDEWKEEEPEELFFE